MECPNCHQNASRVVDSRPSDENRAIRRRRECENCGFRFTTFERIELAPLLVVKNNGTRESFSRGKILNGLVRAAEKRPISGDELEQITDRIENNIRKLGTNEISTKQIGESVMDELAKVDDVAYIRFASVYRQFQDMGSFKKTLEEMMSKNEQDKK